MKEGMATRVTTQVDRERTELAMKERLKD